MRSRPPAAATALAPALLLAACLIIAACSDDPAAAADDTEPTVARPVACVHSGDEEPDSLPRIGCMADFQALASEPADASIPGARSVKTVIDRVDGSELHFQNSVLYPIHHDFVSAHLSGQGLPPVGPLSQFNATEYYSPDRRFLLGALTNYEGPKVWAYEISPYDTASAEMITTAYDAVSANLFSGAELVFVPSSVAVANVAKELPARVKVMSRDTLYAGVDYQPLNIAKSVGRLVFTTAKQAEVGPLYFRDLVVLDSVPNDIGVVAGIITGQFQTPLSHINVLSKNRGTPNMALRNAQENKQLKALEGKWVELAVGPFEWTIKEVSEADAQAWWQTNKPAAVAVPAMNVTMTTLTDMKDLLQLDPSDPQGTIGAALKKAIPAFGGKASHYAAFHWMNLDKDGKPVLHADGRAIVPVPKAFAIPLSYYRQFMSKAGFDKDVATLIADPKMGSDPVYRDGKLEALRDAIKAAAIDPDLLAAVLAKLKKDYPGVRMRFRSSTNAEDLDGFTGAGLYTSKSGDPSDPDKPVDLAIKQVWASIFTSRAWQERAYRSIPHDAVGMAILVHRSFPDEEANGVALTFNPFDIQGAEPGYFINVQVGEESVVKPEPGVTTDSFIYLYAYPNQPQVFISHSSLVPAGQTVLTTAQTHRLAAALTRIHQWFQPLYGANKPYAMDVEFKFDGEPGELPPLFVKQCRPFGG